MSPVSFWRADRPATARSARAWRSVQRAAASAGSYSPTVPCSRWRAARLGVALAPLAMRALIAFLPRDAAANALQTSIDLRLLLFAFLVSMAAGVLSGFAPALASWPPVADFFAARARRHRIGKRPASQGHGDGSNCLHLDPGDRSGVVCAHPDGTAGQRAGIRYIQPGLVRPRSICETATRSPKQAG